MTAGAVVGKHQLAARQDSLVFGQELLAAGCMFQAHRLDLLEELGDILEPFLGRPPVDGVLLGPPDLEGLLREKPDERVVALEPLLVERYRPGQPYR